MELRCCFELLVCFYDYAREQAHRLPAYVYVTQALLVRLAFIAARRLD